MINYHFGSLVGAVEDPLAKVADQMSEEAVLEVRNLQRAIGDRVIIANLSFTVRRGDILFVRGPSGVGKSLLLRALAYLDPIQDGSLLLDGKTPEGLGVPQWRTQVTYVPQSRTQQKGTPSELYYQAQQFKAQRGRPRGDLPALVAELGLEQRVLNQPWVELSGGQAQRVTLAICLALKPSFLLLDEPTSALDHEAAVKVERLLRESKAACIWVTHEDAQVSRVGGRALQLPLGTEIAVDHLLSPERAVGGPGEEDLMDVEDGKLAQREGLIEVAVQQ